MSRTPSSAFAPPALPGVLRVADRVLRPVAPRLFPLDPETIKRRAREKAGLEDFGDLAPLDEPLRVMCDSFATEAALTTTGRLGIRSQLQDQLVKRLQLTDVVARHPEIFEPPVTAPVFIIGTPRTGTTFLHRMLTRDPSWYWTPYWEAREPIPPAGDVPADGPDPRIRAGERALEGLRKVMPEFLDLHELENEESEIELVLRAAGFASSTYASDFLPTFARWYESADLTDYYRMFRRYLQLMQSTREPGGRWLLKIPGHLDMLGPLVSVFPDATLVFTHRDPVASTVSLAGLITYGLWTSDARADLGRYGRIAAGNIERQLRRSIAFRDGDGAAGVRLVDVAFADVVGDPIGTARVVSEAVGREPDEATFTAMREYAERPRGHRSRVRFTAETFGLDVGALRERYAFYYDRFKVPVDAH